MPLLLYFLVWLFSFLKIFGTFRRDLHQPISLLSRLPFVDTGETEKRLLPLNSVFLCAFAPKEFQE